MSESASVEVLSAGPSSAPSWQRSDHAFRVPAARRSDYGLWISLVFGGSSARGSISILRVRK